MHVFPSEIKVENSTMPLCLTHHSIHSSNLHTWRSPHPIRVERNTGERIRIGSWLEAKGVWKVHNRRKSYPRPLSVGTRARLWKPCTTLCPTMEETFSIVSSMSESWASIVPNPFLGVENRERYRKNTNLVIHRNAQAVFDIISDNENFQWSQTIVTPSSPCPNRNHVTHRFWIDTV